MIHPDTDKPGVLAGLLERFRRSGFGRTNLSRRNLSSVQVYTSKDGTLSMDILTFAHGEHSTTTDVNVDESAALFEKVKGSEGTYVTAQKSEEDPTKGVIHVAAANVITSLALQRAARVIEYLR